MSALVRRLPVGGVRVLRKLRLLRMRGHPMNHRAWPYRVVNKLFLRIAEPRVVRLVQFGIYLGMISAGFGVFATPPRAFEGVVGYGLTLVLGGFLAFGGAAGAVAVLPGLWWLERVGIIALITAFLMYSVIVVALGASFTGFIVSVTFILTFIQRWLEIRRFQVAPVVPVVPVDDSRE